jgi:hypothetical protein
MLQIRACHHAKLLVALCAEDGVAVKGELLQLRGVFETRDALKLIDAVI